MKRDISTSTIGREESRKKPLLAAYLFQRRILFGCSILMVVSLIIWIVAISSDHWIIISGKQGIFISETRRFFIKSHSGLWRHCRYTVTPSAQANAQVVRNFTSFAYPTTTMIYDGRTNASSLPFIKEYGKLEIQEPLKNFTEEAKKRMFAHWVRNEMIPFETLKTDFLKYVNTYAGDQITPRNAKPIVINPLNVTGIRASNIFGPALQELVVNGTTYYFVMPKPAQLALFSGWNEKPYVPYLLWPYIHDLGLPGYVVNEDHVILQLVPPLPPKKGNKAHGYDYTLNTRCTYIEMFPNSNSLRNELGFNDEIMDYIRTQASFACITVFVMIMGSIFSFYTFMNPRYMFKRLAGGINLVAASTALVVVQVLISSVEYTKSHLFYAYPQGAELKYGYGVYLAWFVFSCNILCGLLFLWYSGKKKGAKAPTDEIAMADEPTIMGR